MDLAMKRAEFDRYLWDHASDAFQAQFDERRALTDDELRFLSRIHAAAVLPDNSDACDALRREITRRENGLALLLQICGLTRNKIVVDLKASGDAKRLGIRLPASFSNYTNPEPWRLAGPYLLTRLRRTLGHIGPQEVFLADVFEAINQATWPGYIRQERAKRSGHEAEYRIATLLASLGIPFEPFEKADNPLCRDAQIDGISFDVVVPDVSRPLVLVKSTVHTANIGQYGESKDHLEINEARQWIGQREWDDIPTLLAFIDGIGFRSNSAGLNGVLSLSDEFCQFKTIWKVAMIAASRLGMQIEIALPHEAQREFAPFLERWATTATIYGPDEREAGIGWLEAGEALIRQKG